MAKIVYASLQHPTALRTDARVKTVASSKIVTAPDGSRLTVATVDADSSTFNQDLTVAFERNVARARRENRRIRGDGDAVASGV